MQEDIELQEQIDALLNLTNEELIGVEETPEQKKEKDIKCILKKCTETTVDDNVEAVYYYKNIDGTIRYKVEKLKNGEPFMVQSYQNGNWEYGLNGIKKIPYNLPNITKANNEVIFIVNGERKVDEFETLGFTATTAPFNSTHKWKRDFNNYLKTLRGVIIIEDNKENSAEYAQNTFETIKRDISNVGIVAIKDMAKILNVELEENTDIIDLKEKLNNDDEFKNLLTELEKQM